MSRPEISTHSGAIHFVWASWALHIGLTRFRDGGRGPTCELTASIQQQDKLKTLTSATVSLSSLSVRESLAKRFKKLYDLPDWDTVIETVCVKGLQEFRRCEPLSYLNGQEAHTVESFVLNPLIYERHPTLIYGPGDSGKSFFALYCACLLSVGGSENGLACSDWPVLYLDWELAYEEMNTRLTMLKAGHPSFKPVNVAYKRPTAPLADCLEEIRATITETGARVLIVDSLALAAGAELERAETAIRFHQAIRQLGLPCLLLGHTAKNSEEKTPFGSVFFFNLARTVWEVRKSQEPDAGIYRFGLYHKKCNLGPRRSPLGFAVTIADGCCQVTTADLSEEPELRQGLPLQTQIETVLHGKSSMTARAIAGELGAKEASVRVTLNRYKGKKWTTVSEGEWATF